jgi:hypothetical protein
MILMHVAIPCPECAGRSAEQADAQPNYCRMCGGSGELRKKISHEQLSRLPGIPQVLSAIVVIPDRRPPRKKRGR